MLCRFKLVLLVQMRTVDAGKAQMDMLFVPFSMAFSIIFNKGLVWIALWFLLQLTIGKLLPLSQPYLVLVKDELAFEDYYYGFCLYSPCKI
ncbi:hypothetical protein CMV_016092 [Castanea mollissima]|uniref:Uncharacterized protein n=1 Tax=Castanea mollissima TaxID=60419 RepID=A0A8J4QUA4_9ROSI|nr:hypothetical protein CMV_016092 [Castanea mollissima]